jgi:glyoxylase-like metal-dependent hydrolase (beta-lactamase superfamily II)
VKPQIHPLYDPLTGTLSYVVWDALTLDAVVIDSLIDFDPSVRMTSRLNMDRLVRFVRAKNLNVHWILDTHAHADHFTAGRELKRLWPQARWGMASAMSEVFANLRKVFKWPGDVKLEKLGVDRWFRDGEEFRAGTLMIDVIATPGHTPACLTYRIGENLFTGDTILMPDFGTGRCDFPGGSAARLYDSIHGKLYALPDHYRIWVGHDYPPDGRPVRWTTTVGEEKAENVHLRAGTSRAEFVLFREARDKTLKAPRLLDPSLDWNLGAHQLVKA